MNGSHNSITSIMDGIFDDFFGTSFDNLWSQIENTIKANPENSFYSKLEACTQPDGTILVRDNVNGKEFETRVPGYIVPKKCNNKLPSEIISGTPYPPVDAYVERDSSLNIECPIPGVDSDNIGLSLEGDTIIIEIKAPEIADNSERAYLVRGLKYPEGFKRIKIDPLKWDINKTEYHMKNGMLYLRVPKSQFVHENKILKAIKK